MSVGAILMQSQVFDQRAGFKVHGSRKIGCTTDIVSVVLVELL